jgi:hypothetical protein
MRKLLVRLSGLYLLVFGAFHLTRFWPRYNFIIDCPDAHLRMFYSINFTIITLFAVLAIVMGFGLISFKNWARNMALALSVIAILFGVSIFIMIRFLHHMLPAGVGPMAVNDIRGLYYWLEVLLCLVLVPSFFLYLFTRRSIIKLFARK